MCEEGRIVMKEKSEAHWLPVDTGDDYFGRRGVGEKRIAKFFFSGDARIPKPLVYSEVLNEFEDERYVVVVRPPDINIRQSPGPR